MPWHAEPQLATNKHLFSFVLREALGLVKGSLERMSLSTRSLRMGGKDKQESQIVTYFTSCTMAEIQVETREPKGLWGAGETLLTDHGGTDSSKKEFFDRSVVLIF